MIDRDSSLEQRVQRAQHGRSIAAEQRHVLSEVPARDPVREPNLAEAICRRFGPLGRVDLPLHPPVPIVEPPSFE